MSRNARGLILAWLLVACGGEVPPEPSSPHRFQLDPSCTAVGPLEVELGQGEGGTTFRALGVGDEPVLFHGPQGGTHLALAVRVHNPELAHPGLQVTLAAWVEEEDQSRTKLGRIVLGMGPQDARLVSTDDVGLVVSGLFLVLETWPVERPRLVEMETLDPCGRTGAVAWDLVP